MGSPGTSLEQQVGEWIDAQGLFAPGAGVVVGVSGGADSVALLAVLRDLAARQGRCYRLKVAHLDHALRDESPDEARFVADLARRWGLECVIERVDVAAEADRRREGIEQTARDVRYEFMRRLAVESGCGWVAVGHHADDDAETILYRIARGTHLRGLGGMPPRRLMLPRGVRPPLPGQPAPGGAVQLTRPLLPIRRWQLEQYCRSRQLAWCEDPSNVDCAYRRSVIRCKILPMLRSELNSNVDEALLRLARSAAQVDKYLAQRAAGVLAEAIVSSDHGNGAREELLALDATRLASEDEVLVGYALRLALEHAGVGERKLSSERVAALCEMVRAGRPAAVMLPGGFLVARRGRRVVIALAPADLPSPPVQPPVTLACPGVTPLADGRQVHCRVVDLDGEAFARHCRRPQPGVEYLDAGALSGPLVARCRRRGDSFRPLGAPGSQSVSDFLTNIKLPAARRGQVVCLCDDQGVVYLAPLRLADRAKLTEGTRRAICIELRPTWP